MINPFATRIATNSVCDTPPKLTDFNAEAYMGTWYEISRVPWFPAQPKSDTCTEAIYSNLDTTTA